jgi:hypothetical protein
MNLQTIVEETTSTALAMLIITSLLAASAFIAYKICWIIGICGSLT